MELNKNNYFSQEANLYYLSASQFKSFLPSYGGCEAQAMATLNGEYERPYITAFQEGHYIHAWNEGTLSEFKANNPDLYSSRGATAGQLKSNFQHLNTMIEILENDPLVMKALAGQKETIMTGTLFGMPWKVMLDSYQPSLPIFADLKALKSIDGKWWNKEAQVYENFITHYGYDLQMAIYAEIERQNAKRDTWAIPHMVIVTKENPPDHEVIYFDYDSIQNSLNIIQNHIQRVIAVKTGKEQPIRCEKCDYCKLTKKIQRIKHYGELAVY